MKKKPLKILMPVIALCFTGTGALLFYCFTNWIVPLYILSLSLIAAEVFAASFLFLKSEGKTKKYRIIRSLIITAAALGIVFFIAYVVNNVIFECSYEDVMVVLMCAATAIILTVLFSASDKMKPGIKILSSLLACVSMLFPVKTIFLENYHGKVVSPTGFSEFTPIEKKTVTDADFYVAPDGDDTADGSFSHPFATIKRARDAVRELEKTKDIIVAVKAGEYKVSALTFGTQDSGSEAGTVTYIAYGDGEVVLNGGITIADADFSKVTDEAVLSRLCDGVKEHIICADLKKYGLTADDWGKIYTIGSFTTASQYTGDWNGPLYCELFVNDERQTLARYPNEDYLYTDEVIKEGNGKEGSGKRLGDEWYEVRDPESDVYRIDDALAARIGSWKTLDDVWMFGFWRYDWADASTPIGDFNEAERTLSPKFVSLYGAGKDKPYYFFNVFEELDVPGEWYLDRENGIVYLYEPENAADAVIDLSVTTQPVITCTDAAYLTFDGFTVKGTRGDGIAAAGNNITIRNCLIKNVAGNALTITGYNNLAYANEITHTGKGGIRLDGGDRETLTPGNNKADNNLIYDWAEIYITSNPGVNLSGVGNICSHNEMHTSPHQAVIFSGNNHIIEYNNIHNVCLLTDDAGAIYAGRRWDWYGNVIRYNAVFDLGSGDHKPSGIYMDDALSGQTIYGNLLVNIPNYGIQLGGGRDIICENNVCVNCGTDNSIKYDQRAIDGVFGGWFNHSAEGGDMWTNLFTSPWENDAWKEAYPQMTRFSDDFSNTDDPDFVPNPAYSSVKNNIILNITGKMNEIEEKTLLYSDISDNAVRTIHQTKKIFTDAKNGDYTVQAGAEILGELSDHTPIPVSEIGRY